MLQRHDLLQVEQSAWEAMLAKRADLRAVPLVEAWIRRGYPIMIRRPATCDSIGDLPAALPLPPSEKKLRIALSLAADAKVTKLPPVLLCDTADLVSSEWQPAVRALLKLGEKLSIAPRVFGALLWESITGLSYLTSRSDLDLLWHVPDEQHTAALVEGLRNLEASSPVRIDGELLLPDDAGVNWREVAISLRDPQRNMLVKTMEGVATRSLSTLFRPSVS